ncbi:MAG: hypothetical protein HY014_04790 [Acidobacteria bacterium]|nr:hypothetical protein [Acidobacteriota bacterium]MBI3487468.1 hypothetical protein [Acidobacteriota bacterium]
MSKLLMLLVICIQSAFLFSGDQGAKKYENHVYFFTLDLPGKHEKGLTIVQPKPPQPAHGFSIEIDGKHRSIEIYAGYNATFQENTPETFHEWLRDESVTNMRTLSWGPYNALGFMGFRAILIQSHEGKDGMVNEAIRLLRKSKDGSPGIWYEFRLKSDSEHFIDDSNLFNRLMFSFKPIKSKYFE